MPTFELEAGGAVCISIGLWGEVLAKIKFGTIIALDYEIGWQHRCKKDFLMFFIKV